MSDDNFARPIESRNTNPEQVLWTLTKDGRTAQARATLPAVGTGLFDVRVYSTGIASAVLELTSSEALRDVREVSVWADEKRREYEAQGWRHDETAGAGT